MAVKLSDCASKEFKRDGRDVEGKMNGIEMSCKLVVSAVDGWTRVW